ncbi:MAG: hypothetical protein ACR2P4_00115 [Gammaproteobacteria bacterium]
MPCKKMVSPLQGYIYNNALSRGVAPCYNMSPLQGFNIVIPAPAAPLVIAAKAGIHRRRADMARKGRVLPKMA